MPRRKYIRAMVTVAYISTRTRINPIPSNERPAMYSYTNRVSKLPHGCSAKRRAPGAQVSETTDEGSETYKCHCRTWTYQQPGSRIAYRSDQHSETFASQVGKRSIGLHSSPAPGSLTVGARPHQQVRRPQAQRKIRLVFSVVW